MNKKLINSILIVIAVLIVFVFLGYKFQGEKALIYAEEKLVQQMSRNKELDERANKLETRISELEVIVNDYEEKIKELENELEAWKKKYNTLKSEKKAQKNKQEESVAYITFDDGPSKNTLKVLDILKEKSVKATFFVVGTNSSGDPGIYRRIIEEGHAIGNHTFSHNYSYIYKSEDNFMEDFIKMEDTLLNEGIKTDIMRFPGGSSIGSSKHAKPSLIKRLTEKIRERGYDYFDWSVDSKDGIKELRADEIYDNVICKSNDLEGDLVILFHDSNTKDTTVEALPKVIDELRNRGYKFDSLSKGVVDIKHK
ncbi:MAG: polysaccharide deacetylase family protein [Clostridiales bacterium]|mgnify:CR=1 FL=1|jgi:peptidoglycan/xylan/chitin deacetylase (PgdA/CDA1 family)|nr:polysaccharide deacetylase family protein [Clostridiales bacterium]